MNEPGWSGARLLHGLQAMAGQRHSRFTAGDMCRVRVGVNGGAHFVAGRIIASYPGAFATRSYDVLLTDTRTILRDVSELRLRNFMAVVS